MESDDPFDYIDLDNFSSEVPNIDGFISTPNKENDIKLEEGVEFESIKELQDAYSNYANRKGFQIRRRNSRKNVVQFVCSREGFGKSHKKKVVEEAPELIPDKYTFTSQIGCLACLYCSFDVETSKWRITKFFDHHNHGFVSPRSVKYLRTHKHMPSSARCLTHVFMDQGIGIGRVTDVMNMNMEESEFTKKDCYNYMTKFGKQILDGGDGQAVHNWCIRQQQLNRNFRYEFQYDEHDRLLNFFWIDARSRCAYQIFGDVVSFDTTYRTNKYNMPFAPFVGVDNHMHTILFGCALLQDETEASFVWLFKAWLRAVDNKFPLSFVTDQDMAIMNAVRSVFSTSRHRLCIWHIMKKFPERLSHIYHDKSKFKHDINNCIHESFSVHEFEETWMRLVISNGLDDNEWLKHLYSIRHLWVPIFSKDTFFASMSTTGRSESINAFFDHFVRSGTTLKQFVNKHGRAMDSRYETYRRSEFDSGHKVPRLTLGMGLEEHAASIYTNEIFILFHKELSKILVFNRVVEVEGSPIVTYRVSSRLNQSDNVVVQYNMSTQDAKCECLNFEFKGILCRHILSVYYMHNVDRIPPQFILNRWTKHCGQILWNSPIARDILPTSTVRGLKLQTVFHSLAQMSEESEEIYEMIQKGMDSLEIAARVKQGERETEVLGSTNPPFNMDSEQQCLRNVQDPYVTQTKGRKRSSLNRSTRIRSGIEIANDNVIRCSTCSGIGHNRRTCPKIRGG